MIRKYVGVKTVVQKTEIQRDVICDTCNEVISDRDGFFNVSTGHSRWGLEYLESLEMHHFCCKKCLDAFLDEYWKSPRDTDKADIEFLTSTSRAGCYPGDHVEEIDLESNVLEEKKC